MIIILCNMLQIFSHSFDLFIFNRSNYSDGNSVTCIHLFEDENKIQVSVQKIGHVMLFSFLFELSFLCHKYIEEEALS